MADEPYFPDPNARAAYREAATRPIAPADAEAPAVHVVVRRPEDLDKPLPPIAEAMREDRSFWSRNSFAARNPRLTGVILSAFGSALAVFFVVTLTRGSNYEKRAAIGGATAFCAGIIMVGVGLHRTAAQRPNAGWKAGVLAAAVATILSGIVVFLLLGRA